MFKLKSIVSRILRDDSRQLRFSPLLLASFVYRGAVTLRNYSYDAGLPRARKMKCGVISVGNIVVGGTGKTPVVIMLAGMLRKHGYKPAVLSRGYGGKREGRTSVVSDGHEILMGTSDAGDEPVLIAENLEGVPVIIGKERSRSGKLAVERFGADVLILDDAFQHRRLFRDIDIVLLDREKPFGNGFMLPRGGLREPVKALKRADAIIFTSTEGDTDSGQGTLPPAELPHVPTFSGYRKARDIVRGEAKDSSLLHYLEGKRICAFSGIAEPESFRKIVAPLCGEIAAFMPFPDHHIYTGKDIEHIRKVCSESGAELILTTEKDGIKLVTFPDFFRDLYRLRMEMDIVRSGLNFEEYILTRLET